MIQFLFCVVYPISLANVLRHNFQSFLYACVCFLFAVQNRKSIFHTQTEKWIFGCIFTTSHYLLTQFCSRSLHSFNFSNIIHFTMSVWLYGSLYLSARPPARPLTFILFFFSAVFCSLRTRTYFLFPTHNQNLHRSTWFNQLLICSRTCIYTKHDMIYQCQHISKSYNICTKFIYSFRITRIQKPGERERDREIKRKFRIHHLIECLLIGSM